MHDLTLLIKEILYAFIEMDWTPLIDKIFYILAIGAFLLMVARQTHSSRNAYMRSTQQKANKSRQKMIAQINRNTKHMRKMKKHGKHIEQPESYVDALWNEIK